MRKKVLEKLTQYALLSTNDKLLYIAVSGGIDSIVLLDILVTLKKTCLIHCQLHVIHINHMLRGEESDMDQDFVKSLALNYNIPCTIKHIDIKHEKSKKQGSLQEIARNCRYDYLDDLVNSKNSIVALAHNLNDQAETFFMRCLKGSSPEGLLAMSPKRGKYIRPLLDFSREQIIEYYKQENLQHREDSSNSKDYYIRNYLRHHITPHFNQINPSYLESIQRMIKILKTEQEYMDLEAAKYFNLFVSEIPNGCKIDLPGIKKIHPALQYKILNKIFSQYFKDVKDLTNRHYQACFNLLNKGSTSKIIHLPSNIQAKIEYDFFFLEKQNNLNTLNKANVDKNVSKTTLIIDNFFNQQQISVPLDKGLIEVSILEKPSYFPPKSKKISCFDIDKIHFPLTLRYYMCGDFMFPLGMKGKKKKLNRIFIDTKIAQNERKKIPLLCIDNEVLWIFGQRISENYKITDSTKKVVMLQWIY